VQALVHAGACKAVVAAMTMQDADRQVVKLSCESISAMLTTSDSYGKLDDGGCSHKFHQAGAYEAVAAALNRHYQHRDVALAACRVVVNLHKGDDKENRLATTTEASGCEAVVSALKAHSTDEAVAKQACRAIIVLATIKVNVAILQRIGTAAAVQPLVAMSSDSRALANQIKVILTPWWRKQLAKVAVRVVLFLVAVVVIAGAAVVSYLAFSALRRLNLPFVAVIKQVAAWLCVCFIILGWCAYL
jgi:hypothetical protein